MKPTFKRVGIILLVSGVVAVVANSVHPRKIPWVQDWSSQVEAKAKEHKLKVIPLASSLEKFQTEDSVFIDARSEHEFSRGHIPGALSVPIQSLEEHFALIAGLIDSNRELVIYCRNRDCDDSLLLAIELQAMGADNMVLYIDGYDLWKKHGGATTSLPTDSADAIPPVKGVTE